MQNIYDVYKLINSIQRITTSAYDIGDVKLSARKRDYNGWLVCDGRSMSRSDYKSLFDVIGTQFGSNDSLTFNLPDYKGRVIGMPGSGTGLTARAMGDKVGSETRTLSTNQLPSHSHTGTTAASGSHNHTATSSTAGSHTHATNATGTPYGLATIDGTGTATTSDSTPGEIKVMTTPYPLTVTANGDHSHAITVATAPDHSHGFTTSSVGGNLPFEVMQPTLFGTNVLIYGGVLHDPIQ